MGFWAEWLDSLDEGDLLDTYEWCRSKATVERQRGRWGLASYYRSLSWETMDALSRLYFAQDHPHFDRRQVPLFPRRGPDWRD